MGIEVHLQLEQVREVYRKHGAHADRQLVRGESLSRKLTWARLLTFLCWAFALYGTFEEPIDYFYLPFLVVLSIGFMALVAKHDRVKLKLMEWEALKRSCEEAEATMERDWDKMPRPPKVALKKEDQIQADDLNLRGEQSLEHLLYRRGFERGHGVMMKWMFEDGSAEDWSERQGVAESWSKMPQVLMDWQALSRVGVAWDALDDRAWVAWAEGGSDHRPQKWIWPLLALNLAVWSAVVMSNIGVSMGLLICGVNWIACLLYSRHGAPAEVLRFEREIYSLRRVLEKLQMDPLPLSEAQRDKLNHASGSLKALSRQMGWLHVMRSEMMHGLLRALFAWDLWTFELVNRWRHQHGARLAEHLHFLGELEAWGMLSLLKNENPHWVYSNIIEGHQCVEALGLGHPLLKETQVVRNDVSIGGETPLMVVTGSNMAGKSTLMRALGVNLILSRLGAVVSAASLRQPRLILGTSFRVADSLSQGVSYFMAELHQLKFVVSLLQRQEKGLRLFFLLDEILLGTNLEERREAVARVLGYLLDTGAWGMLATHDLEPSQRESIAKRGCFCYFSESMEEKDGVWEPAFDYQLREGRHGQGNALSLLERVGVLPASGSGKK